MSRLDTGDDAGGFNAPSRNNKEPRWDEKIPWWSYADDDNPYCFRLIGKPTYFYTHWVTTKKKDGQWGKAFGVLCKNYDSVTGKTSDQGCKVCEINSNFNKIYGQQKLEWAKWPQQVQKLSARPTMAINAISRDLQTQGPPPGAKDWTFVTPMKFPKGVAETLIDTAKKFNKSGKPDPTNTKEIGFYGLNHATFGKDVYVSYNSTAKEASKMYGITVGMKDSDRTPLTPDERAAAESHMINFAEHISFMSDATVDEVLQKSGYYDLVQSLQASSALKNAQSRVGLDTTPPVSQEVPRNPPAQEAATTPPIKQSAALDIEDSGGLIHTDENEVPNGATQSAQSSAATAPATPPVQAPVASQPAAPGSDPIVNFATAHNKDVKVVTDDYSSLSLRTVKTGSQVPVCFSAYSKTKAEEPALCKACPIKLDCMQVEP